MNVESMSAAEISLTTGFAISSPADWGKEALKVLSRRRPEDKEPDIGQAYKCLTSHTVDGLVIKSLCTTGDGVKEPGPLEMALFTRSTTVCAGEMDEGWFNAQLIRELDPAETHKTADTDPERGTPTV